MSIRVFAIVVLLWPLAGCYGEPNGVRISAATSSTAPAPAAVVAKARSEPIFYNGKTYQLDFAPAGQGAFAMAVGGMSARQEKDAVAVATSSLRYFACPDGKTGKLTSKPAYAGGAWKMQARCG
jgi:hypothetical protein